MSETTRDRQLQILLQQWLPGAEERVMQLNAAGEVQHQVLVQRQEVGAATHQTTAAAPEPYAHGMLRMLHAKAGHQTAQVPAIGDYPHKMR